MVQPGCHSTSPYLTRPTHIRGNVSVKPEFDLYARARVPYPEGDYRPVKPYRRPTAGEVVAPKPESDWCRYRGYIMKCLQEGREFTAKEMADELQEGRVKLVHDVLCDLRSRRGVRIVSRRRVAERQKLYRLSVDQIEWLAPEVIVEALFDRLRAPLRRFLKDIVQELTTPPLPMP